MTILIVEDEDLAVRRLQKMLLTIDAGLEITGVTDSITATVDWLNTNSLPDLILMDIELADGQSFEVFRRIDIPSAVVFTTSYDDTAVKSFHLSGRDYLLKPIQKDELAGMIEKYRPSR